MRFIILALVFVACTDGAGTDFNTGTNAESDANSGSGSETARLRVEVTRLGISEPCSVQLDGETAGPSGEAITVPTGNYLLTVGDPSEFTEDRLPVHRDAEGVAWVAPPVEVAVFGDEVTEVTLNRYFSGEFSCIETAYRYDSSAPEFKGDFDERYHWDEVVLSVENGREVHTNDRMLTFTNSDVLIIEGDIMSLETSSEKSLINTSIKVNENGETTLSMTVVYELAGAVSDVICEE